MKENKTHSTWHVAKATLVLFATLWGCSASDETSPTTATTTNDQIKEAPAKRAHEEPPPSPSLASLRGPGPHAIEIEVETGHGLQSIFVTEVEGRILFEGDIEIPKTPQGAAVFGHRWYAKTVPYVIASSFPNPTRITEAIAHWEKQTAMRFVPAFSGGSAPADYVQFVAGRGCSASIGRIGGMQNVTLQAGEHITSLVGADFAPSNSRAYFWFKDGLYTIGRSWDVDETQIAANYILPTGKASADVRDMAFASNGDVYTWYVDGTVSIGTPSSLGSKSAPQAFTMPSSETPSSIVGVAFVANGHVRAWYADGTTSEGTAYNLGAYASPVGYVAASGQATSELLSVGVSGDNVYTWYRNAQASGGTATNLAATYAPYTVATPGHCGTPEVIHEIGHAIGFEHEQTRSDRDQYVTINWPNIADANVYNFQAHDAGSGDFGAYDYASIMHYESYAFSKNGQPTILRKDGGLIGYASVLSVGDIAAIATMYP